MSKVDMNAIFKNLNKDEPTDLILLAQVVLTDLFNCGKIKYIIKKIRYSKIYRCQKFQYRYSIKIENLDIYKDIFIKNVDLYLMILPYPHLLSLN